MTLRIAVITETFYPFKGGSAKRYLEIFSRLVRKGYDVDVYTVRLSENWPYEEEYRGINIIRTSDALPKYITKDGFRDGLSIIKYLLWLRRRFNPKEYDIIEANHCPIFPVFLARYKKESGQALVSTVHEVWYDEWYNYVPHWIYAPFGMALEKLMMYMPDHFISVSSFTTKRLIKLLRVDARKISTIYNGVDLEFYKGIYADKETGKIIYGGRLNPHKRLDLLLKSFQYLYKRYDVNLDIFGDGPMKEYIYRYISRNGMSKRVYIYGRVDDRKFAYLMKRGYIYVLPSIREGQSITTMEAMAAGTPQITVRARNNAAYELVSEARSGLVADLDARDIAAKIEILINNGDLWRELKFNGLSFITQYDWDSIAEMHREVYEPLSRR